jgi:hypothetical protein
MDVLKINDDDDDDDPRPMWNNDTVNSNSPKARQSSLICPWIGDHAWYRSHVGKVSETSEATIRKSKVTASYPISHDTASHFPFSANKRPFDEEPIL